MEKLIKKIKKEFNEDEQEEFYRIMRETYDKMVEKKSADLVLKTFWYPPGSSWSGGPDDIYEEIFNKYPDYEEIFYGKAKHHGPGWHIFIDKKNRRMIGLVADGEFQSPSREHEVYSVQKIGNDKLMSKADIEKEYPGLIKHVKKNGDL